MIAARPALLAPPLLVSAVLSATPLLHDDPPGPPQLVVRAAVVGTRLVPASPGASVNNELSTEEMRLIVVSDHQNGHGQGMVVADSYFELNCCGGNLPFRDASAGPVTGSFERKQALGGWAENALDLNYRHRDCTPRDPLVMTASIVELDADPTLANVITVVGAGVSLVGLIPPATVAATIVGLALTGIGLAVSNDADDSYGTAAGIVPANGRVTITTTGPAGTAQVTIEGTTGPSGANACVPPVTQVAPPPADTRGAMLYTPLEDGYRMAASTAPEPGNSKGLTTFDTLAVRAETERFAMGLGAASAGLVVQEATRYAGGAAAREEYLAARQLDLGGQDLAALPRYREAFVRGIEAIESGEMVAHEPPPDEVLLASDLVFLPPNAAVTLRGVVIGLGPGESLRDVALRTQVPGLTGIVRPGFETQGLALDADLSASARTGDLVGLDRVTGHRIAPPSATCARPFVEDGTQSRTGILIDGRGPYPQPPGPCGYGTVVTTPLLLSGGATPAGAGYANGAFSIDLDLDGVTPGSYGLQVAATIERGGTTATVTSPLTVVVARPRECTDCLVYDDGTFEHGYGIAAQAVNASFVMRFDPPAGEQVLDKVYVCWTRNAADTDITFDVDVYDVGAGGVPGNLLARLPGRTATSIPSFPSRTFFGYDTTSLGLKVDEPVFIGPRWDPGQAAGVFLCADETSPAGRRPGYFTSQLGTPLTPIESQPDFSGYRALGIRAAFLRAVAAPACVRDAETACLLGGRYEVKLRMWDFANPPDGPGNLFVGKVQLCGDQRSETDQSVTFYSFEVGNIEVFLKMVDACALPDFQSFWVFAAGATNAETEILIRDTVSGQVYRIQNPRGRVFVTTADTQAFRTCFVTASRDEAGR